MLLRRIFPVREFELLVRKFELLDHELIFLDRELFDPVRELILPDRELFDLVRELTLPDREGGIYSIYVAFLALDLVHIVIEVLLNVLKVLIPRLELY